MQHKCKWVFDKTRHLNFLEDAQFPGECFQVEAFHTLTQDKQVRRHIPAQYGKCAQEGRVVLCSDQAPDRQNNRERIWCEPGMRDRFARLTIKPRCYNGVVDHVGFLARHPNRFDKILCRPLRYANCRIGVVEKQTSQFYNQSFTNG